VKTLYYGFYVDRLVAWLVGPKESRRHILWTSIGYLILSVVMLAVVVAVIGIIIAITTQHPGCSPSDPICGS